MLADYHGHTHCSGSHEKAHPGTHIRQTARELKKLGFTQFCTYECMKSIWHDLL